MFHLSDNMHELDHIQVTISYADDSYATYALSAFSLLPIASDCMHPVRSRVISRVAREERGVKVKN